MTSALSSFLGIALQTGGKGVPVTTDNLFKYLLFNQGGISPQNIVLPLDAEVGGGAMLRDVKKVGVTTGGGVELIPRPSTLGYMLLGATGNVVSVSGSAGSLYNEDTVMGRTALTASTQTITAPNTNIDTSVLPSIVSVTGYPANGTLTGNVTISGISSGSATTDVIALNGAASVVGTKSFTSITSIALPVQVNAGDSVAVGVKASSAATNKHKFTLGTDQFTAPYFTIRSAPGNMWGEQYQDCRFNSFGFEFRGANFVRSQLGIVGGLPTKVATTSWNAINYVDTGPQLITPVSAIELPTGTSAKVLAGAFTAGMAIPLDEQWVIGSYSPDDFQISSRAFSVSFSVKIADATLYSKVMYDPAGGSAWAASLMREANFRLDLVSDQTLEANFPNQVSIRGNGYSGQNANIIWSAEPVGIRAGKQVVMNVTGMFVADPTSAVKPIEISLFNSQSSYAS